MAESIDISIKTNFWEFFYIKNIKIKKNRKK